MKKHILPESDCLLHCPFCFEQISLRIDLSAGANQSFVYDCEVCCRPIVVTCSVDAEGEIQVTGERES